MSFANQILFATETLYTKCSKAKKNQLNVDFIEKCVTYYYKVSIQGSEADFCFLDSWDWDTYYLDSLQCCTFQNFQSNIAEYRDAATAHPAHSLTASLAKSP